MKKTALWVVILCFALNVLAVWASVGEEQSDKTSQNEAVITLLFIAAIVWAFWHLYSYARRDRWIPITVTVIYAFVALTTAITVRSDSESSFRISTGMAVFTTVVAALMIRGALRLYNNRRVRARARS